MLVDVLPQPSGAAPTVADKCEAGKNGTSAKYTTCLHKARQKYVLGGLLDTAAYNTAVTSCATKYQDKWTSLETKAGPGGCPSEGDESPIQTFLDACTLSVEDALHGVALPLNVTTCNSNLSVCGADLADCQSDLAACLVDSPAMLETGQTICFDPADVTNPTDTIACAGTGQDGELQLGVARSYTDNGDGTITDNQTHLMWEKLTDNATIHDKDNWYTWADAFAVKIATLNTMSFGGHTDWRLPNVRELLSIVDYAGTGALAVASEFHTACTPGCDGIACSCTRADYYWTSTTYSAANGAARTVSLSDGTSSADFKTTTIDVFARAVRTAAP